MLSSYILGSVALAFVALAIRASYTWTWRPAFPKNAPRLVSENNVLFGAWQFWTDRWSFFSQSMAHSSTGNFSFYAGRNRVVGLSGDDARKWFVESKELHLNQGYSLMLGPSDDEIEDGQSIERFLTTRIANLLRGENIIRTLPVLIQHTRKNLEEFGRQQWNKETLFDVVYRWVFISTAQIVAPHDIINDPKLLRQMIDFFSSFEQNVSPTFLLFPKLPTWTAIRRFGSSFATFLRIKKIVDNRKKTGPIYGDALDFMIEQGDSEMNQIRMVFALLIAGLFNSGYNAAWLVTEFFLNPDWLKKVRQEVADAVDKAVPDKSIPFLDRLSQLKFKDWEDGFPTIDICLKEVIRIRTAGCLMRKNITGHDLVIGTETIPNDTHVMYHIKDIHFDPEIYPNPGKWDPSRFEEAKGEDKKKEHAYIGWGAGRHPCAGIRYAKLENYVLLAFFVSMFDFEVCYADGSPLKESPPTPPADLTMRAPSPPLYMKVRPREKPGSV
ncbi:cytochrome P450 [Microthyrium microscopicum]|uniref:Cytochrome P450 n=1 Tax=Microthyrium microscopicum TaxID=703497 RepID=A0A6A6U914_9PEZI|nr:cytochrome P450 [Microthyrium microscopicum]